MYAIARSRLRIPRSYRRCLSTALLQDRPPIPEPSAAAGAQNRSWNFLKYSLVAALTGGAATAGYATYGTLCSSAYFDTAISFQCGFIEYFWCQIEFWASLCTLYVTTELAWVMQMRNRITITKYSLRSIVWSNNWIGAPLGMGMAQPSLECGCFWKGIGSVIHAMPLCQ